MPGVHVRSIWCSYERSCMYTHIWDAQMCMRHNIVPYAYGPICIWDRTYIIINYIDINIYRHHREVL